MSEKFLYQPLSDKEAEKLAGGGLLTSTSTIALSSFVTVIGTSSYTYSTAITSLLLTPPGKVRSGNATVPVFDGVPGNILS